MVKLVVLLRKENQRQTRHAKYRSQVRVTFQASQVIRLTGLLLVFVSRKKSTMSEMKWQSLLFVPLRRTSKDSLTRQGM